MTRKGKSARETVKVSRKRVSIKISGAGASSSRSKSKKSKGPKEAGDHIEKKWSAASSKPALRREGKYVTISHSCQVSTVSRSFDPITLSHAAPVVTRYDLNPRNQLMFPWMSNIASLYDQAHLVKAVFRIVPTCGGLATGEMALAFDPDAADATPESLSDMTNMRSVVGAATSDCIALDVSNMNITPWIFVGANPAAVVPANTFGQLFVGTAGIASTQLDTDNTEVGVLWVDFTVRFRYPEMITTDVANSNGAFAYVEACLNVGPNGAVPTTTLPPLFAAEGTLPVNTTKDNFGAEQGFIVSQDDVVNEYEAPGLYKTTLELVANTVFSGPTTANLSNPTTWPLLVYKDKELLPAMAYDVFDKQISLVYNTSSQLVKILITYWANITLAYTRIKTFYTLSTALGSNYFTSFTSERVAYMKAFTLSSVPRAPYVVRDVVAAARAARRAKLLSLGVTIEAQPSH